MPLFYIEVIFLKKKPPPDLVHEFMESLADKIDDVKTMIDESQPRKGGATAAEEEAEAFNNTASGTGDQYRYEFTNAKFLAFLAALDPLEYLIVIDTIAALIALNLNLLELQVTYNFLNNIAGSMQTILVQELLQQTLNNQRISKQKDAALQTDVNRLNQQMMQLQEKIKQLEGKLEET